MAFQFASTNLVLELGIILAVLIGWQFVAAEYVRDYRCASVPNLLANRNPGQSDRGFCPYSMVAI